MSLFTFMLDNCIQETQFLLGVTAIFKVESKYSRRRKNYLNCLQRLHENTDFYRIREKVVQPSPLPQPYLTGGRIPPPLRFFFHHPETPQAIKLKHSDFKDTSLRHTLQVISLRYILTCYQGNKITKGTMRNLPQLKSEFLK